MVGADYVLPYCLRFAYVFLIKLRPGELLVQGGPAAELISYWPGELIGRATCNNYLFYYWPVVIVGLLGLCSVPDRSWASVGSLAVAGRTRHFAG